jgi:hypothetical protein
MTQISSSKKFRTQISLSQNHRRHSRSVWRCLSHARCPLPSVVPSATVALETRATWSRRAYCSRFMFPNPLPHLCDGMPAKLLHACLIITKIQNHHRLTLVHHLVIRSCAQSLPLLSHPRCPCFSNRCPGTTGYLVSAGMPSTGDTSCDYCTPANFSGACTGITA